VKHTFADGKEYELGPITLGDHRRYRDAMKREQEKPEAGRTLDPGLSLILASLKRYNPDITTIEQVADLVSFTSYDGDLRAVFIASGIMKAEDEKPAGEPTPVPETASA
jgi:hypothetical protein